MLRYALLLPLAALCAPILAGCPEGSGGHAESASGGTTDNFLISKWRAPEACVEPSLEFTPTTQIDVSKAIGPYPSERSVTDVIHGQDGPDRVSVEARRIAGNVVFFRRVDADHIQNDALRECAYTREL